MATLASLVEDVRSYLDGDRAEQANTLAANYTPGSGTVALTYDLGAVGPGAIVSTGLNTMRVFGANAVAKTATVKAGWNGSTDAAASAGDLLRVNPRFTDHRITQEINNAVLSLSSPANGLYQVGTKDLTFDATVEGYDLSGITGLIRVLEVRRDLTGPSQAWIRIRPGEWEVQRSAKTTDFASGVALRLNLDGSPKSHVSPFSVAGITAFAVQVVYAAAFTQLTNLTADVATTGLPATAYDLPVLGAAIRLMAGREVERNAPSSQGDSRRANEVPPGAVARSYGPLISLYQQRINEEAARLRTQYPVGW